MVTESLRDIVGTTRAVLFDFDGPLCRLFAGHPADKVAGLLRAHLSERGVTDPGPELASSDPQAVLRAVGRRVDGLVDGLEELLTTEEIRATATAMPTAWADPLIRTWAAVGVRPAVVTDNSPRAVLAYLKTRGLTTCFGPHVHGRTKDPRLLKPHPDSLRRALAGLAADPAHTLMIGDSPRDIEAARAVGVPFLGYARNARKEEALRDAGAGLVVGSLEDVLRAVREGSRPVAA